MEGNMRIITGIFFLTCLGGSAWALHFSPAPAPEIDTGILGMAAAAGVIYLAKRFKQS
jgi:hypothetical protein